MFFRTKQNLKQNKMFFRTKQNLKQNQMFFLKKTKCFSGGKHRLYFLVVAKRVKQRTMSENGEGGGAAAKAPDADQTPAESPHFFCATDYDWGELTQDESKYLSDNNLWKEYGMTQTANRAKIVKQLADEEKRIMLMNRCSGHAPPKLYYRRPKSSQPTYTRCWRNAMRRW